MSKGDKCKLRVMAWNVGFGSRKELPEDSERAKKVREIVNKLEVDLVALQEMGNAEYSIGLPPFNFEKYLRRSDPLLNSFYFLPTISLGSRHCYPHGKIREINNTAGVCLLEYGPGIWVRNVNGWYLRNLWSDKNIDRATVEVQRPMPHPLYMGNSPAPEGHEADKQYSAGRDEEDRPVLWSRIDKMRCEMKGLRFFFLSLHLPTLKGEEQGNNVKSLNKTQKSIVNITLSSSEQDLQDFLANENEHGDNSNIVDVLASKLRLKYLEQVLAQCERIEKYWKHNGNKCVFIFAGDFNFQHSFQQSNNNQPVKKPEETFLDSNGFSPAKTSGFSRTRGRLVDNIWVKGPKELQVNEHTIDGEQIEIANDYKERLQAISDHYPVVADIDF